MKKPWYFKTSKMYAKNGRCFINIKVNKFWLMCLAMKMVWKEVTVKHIIFKPFICFWFGLTIFFRGNKP